MENNKILAIVLIGISIIIFIISRIQPYPKILLSITEIDATNCEKCYNMTPLIKQFEELNAHVITYKRIQYPKDISKEELLKMNITKLPAVLIKGNIEAYPQLTDFISIFNATPIQRNIMFFKEKVFVIQPPEPVYYDVVNNKSYGILTIIEIKPPDCEKCNNMSSFRKKILSLASIGHYYVADYNTQLAQELINRYNITRLPAVVISPEAKDYILLSQEWKNIGIASKDGYFVSTSLTPPFYSIPEHRVVGLVNITYLYDPLCKRCYDYNIHREVLERFYVVIDKERAISIYTPEGKRLIEKYNITAVPTFIATGDLKYYKELMKRWDQVGTIEEDGTFVFRNMKKMPGRIYVNLTTNSTMIGG